MAARANQLSAQLEAGGYSYRLDDHVGPEALGKFANDGERILTAVVEGEIGTETLGGVQAGVGKVDGDHTTWRVELRPGDCRQADPTGTNDCDPVARLALALVHADLVAGGENVRHHEDLRVRGSFG